MNSKHIPDDELIRGLDGELTGAARAELDARLAATPEGHTRLELLHKRSDRLSELLRELNPEPEQVSRSAHTLRPEVERAALRARAFTMTPAMKAAAIVVLLLATALAVPPVRAWVLEKAAGIVNALRSQEPDLAPAPVPSSAPEAAPAEAPVTYNFVVERDTLDVFIAASADMLVVRRENRELASAQIIGSGQVTVTGTQVRFEGSVAGARLLVPAHVRAVRLHTSDGVRVEELPAPAQGR